MDSNESRRINPRLAKSILHALEGGMVPENGLPYIAVGRKEEVEIVTHDMDRIAEAISIIVKEKEAGIPAARAIVDELTAKYPLK